MFSLFLDCTDVHSQCVACAGSGSTDCSACGAGYYEDGGSCSSKY